MKAASDHIRQAGNDVHASSRAWWCGGSSLATRLPTLLTMRHFRSVFSLFSSSEPSDLCSTSRSSLNVTRASFSPLLSIAEQVNIIMQPSQVIIADASDYGISKLVVTNTPQIQSPLLRRPDVGLLHTVIKALDAPSAVCFALTCKTSTSLVLDATARTRLNGVCPHFIPRQQDTDLPLSTIISYIKNKNAKWKEEHQVDIDYANLMLQLRDWMPQDLWLESDSGKLYTRKQRDEAQWRHCKQYKGHTHLEFVSFDQITGTKKVKKGTPWRICPRWRCQRKNCWPCGFRWTCEKHESQLDEKALRVTGQDECDCPGKGLEGETEPEVYEGGPERWDKFLHEDEDDSARAVEFVEPYDDPQEEMIIEAGWEETASDYLESLAMCKRSRHATRGGSECPHWPYGFEEDACEEGEGNCDIM